jgi:replicative DNA helicase
VTAGSGAADFSELVFTPSRVRDVTLSYIQELKKDVTGIPIGIPRIDDYLVPPRPGELVVVLARPGHGKSSLISHYATMASERTILHGPSVGFPIIVTAEMSIEDFSLRRISTETGISTSRMKRGVDDGSWESIEQSARTLQNNKPIIFIGHSLERSAKRPGLTIENVWRGLDWLYEKHRVTPALVCIDYLQRMKLDRVTRDRRTEVSEIVESCKDMALQFSVPVILGSQAGRGVEERNPPIPTLSDGKESGSIEESADVVISLFRPISVYKEGELIPNSKAGLVCAPSLFYMSVLKQRGGEAGAGFWLSFDMSTSRLSDLELVRHELN